MQQPPTVFLVVFQRVAQCNRRHLASFSLVYDEAREARLPLYSYPYPYPLSLRDDYQLQELRAKLLQSMRTQQQPEYHQHQHDAMDVSDDHPVHNASTSALQNETREAMERSFNISSPVMFEQSAHFQQPHFRRQPPNQHHPIGQVR